MGYRRDELAVGEQFHCYSRTIVYSRPFEHAENTERFLETLYLANQRQSMPNIPALHKKHSHEEIFLLERSEPLVRIGSYCVMPTHYHFQMQPAVENGITEFMHKVGTGFTRFYNDKNERVGNLFIKPFRSKRIANEAYFYRVPNYIHLNPVELFEPQWKRGHVHNKADLKSRLLSYPYSSLRDFEGIARPQKNLLDPEYFFTIRSNLSSLESELEDAIEYYRFLELDL
jgi:putative transposase